MQEVPDACHEQIRMHIEILQTGEQRGMGWYALLHDGEEEVSLLFSLRRRFPEGRVELTLLSVCLSVRARAHALAGLWT